MFILIKYLTIFLLVTKTKNCYKDDSYKLAHCKQAFRKQVDT